MSTHTEAALEPQVIQHVHVAKPMSAMAIAGFVCSVVGISILGLIFSGIALPKTNREQSGRGLAIAGVVVGVLGTIGWILLWVVALTTDPALDGYDSYSHVAKALA